jgi:hypothetical protein
MTINVTMGPAALAETVNVVGSTTSVLTETAQVATNFHQDLIALRPTNRTIDAVILRAPAVHPTGPNGADSIAGAMSFESLCMVNGVTVNENLRGQPFNLIYRRRDSRGQLRNTAQPAGVHHAAQIPSHVRREVLGKTCYFDPHAHQNGHSSGHRRRRVCVRAF